MQLSLNVLLVMDCDAARKYNPQKWPLLANESSVAQRLEHPTLYVLFISSLYILHITSHVM